MMTQNEADLLSYEFIHGALYRLILAAQIAQLQCEQADKEGLHRTVKQLIACTRAASGEFKEVLAREAK
jgi:hypothetical protein